MFGGRVVLKVGHATFQSGAISGIIGPSGSGKSTLLSIIAGFLQPATGKVEYRDGGRLGPPTMSDISWVPQGAYLLPDRTVLDNVALGALSVGLELAVAKFTALRALERLDSKIAAAISRPTCPGRSTARSAGTGNMCAATDYPCRRTHGQPRPKICRHGREHSEKHAQRSTCDRRHA